MSENGSLEIKDFLVEFNKTFNNLLKEFPKTAADDFIYDGSTIKKIGKASVALAELSTRFEKKDTAIPNIKRIKESHESLSQLMDELPRAPADDFSYDRSIHQLVERARQILAELTGLYS